MVFRLVQLRASPRGPNGNARTGYREVRVFWTVFVNVIARYTDESLGNGNKQRSVGLVLTEPSSDLSRWGWGMACLIAAIAFLCLAFVLVLGGYYLFKTTEPGCV